jgi:excisionase family DNA binding protein
MKKSKCDEKCTDKTDKTPELMEIGEACAFLNVKASWLRYAVFKNKVPYIKLGRLVRFSKKDIIKWLDRNKVSLRVPEHHKERALREIEMIESGKMSLDEIDASLQVIKMHISYL